MIIFVNEVISFESRTLTLTDNECYDSNCFTRVHICSLEVLK